MSAKTLEHPALSDLASLTGTTVVYREVGGAPEMVVVCGDCSEIQVVGLRDAMGAALREFMKWHRESQHGPRDARSPEKEGQK